MWESIFQALRDAGIALPEGTTEVALIVPGGQEFTAEVPPDLVAS
jgi:hypothetical protein